MRTILVLIALLGLAVHPAMAALPIDNGPNESATGERPSQEKSVPAQLPDGSMVLVPAGKFTMGSSTGDADEQPAHLVYVDAFLMDIFEVTVRQYAAFLQATGANSPSDWMTVTQPAYEKYPVTNIDWADATAYCKWVGKRLPTEAEWEKAARGTDDRLYPWGNDPPTPRRANYGKTGSHSHGALTPVGTWEGGKSPYGIYDMAGNVWEWVGDWYDNDYYKNSPPQNPIGPLSGESKVLRGGSWDSDPKQLRSTLRYFHRSGHQHKNYGFRCAKTP
jgi:formylglycine-generating enzyme required for sulfatase activity